MTNNTQPAEALRLAKMLTANEWPGHVTLVSYAQECVAELLRQHAENETMRAGYAAARLEIESLKAQLHAAKQINAVQQPTQAVQPAGWEPEFDQFLSDVMTAAGLVTHGKQCKQLGERLGDAVMKLRKVAASIGRKV